MRAAVDIYSASLETDPTRLDLLYGSLSDEERERAGRFRFAEHRRHYIACRGMLREVLAPYLDVSPPHLKFEYNYYGKPTLRGTDVRFNVSHSEGWAMFAVTRGREVGVDVEFVDERFVREQIPERFFSPREVRALRSLPAAQQTDAFFRCWTRKEAYIKARGLGLALALDSFDVSLQPQEPAELLRGGGNWSLQELQAPEGFQAAVASEGWDWRVVLREMPLPQVTGFSFVRPLTVAVS
ncbi:MAG TPA: 4'-phosphopantetheinyl transferase superfamily protein [Bryobacteraceae bacterium]|jgi:4'-phosphopantetheinyl transferase